MVFAWRSVVIAIALVAIASTLSAQTVRTGSIAGHDHNEAAPRRRPASVTPASPALQAPHLVKVSDSKGLVSLRRFAGGANHLQSAGFSGSSGGHPHDDGVRGARDAVLKVARRETVVVSGRARSSMEQHARWGRSAKCSPNCRRTRILRHDAVVPGANQGPPQVRDRLPRRRRRPQIYEYSQRQHQ